MDIRDTKRGNWYWLGSSSEGDIWTPAYCSYDGVLDNDGTEYTKENIGSAPLERALMPHELSSIKDIINQ